LDVPRSRAFLDAERYDQKLGRAERFPSPVCDDHEGDVLDLDRVDRRGVGDAPARGFKYSSFKTQPGRRVDAMDGDGDVLELSPHSPAARVPAATMGRAERWMEYDEPSEGLQLSPQRVEKHRRGFDFQRAPDRWRLSEEAGEEIVVDQDRLERARRATAAPVPDLGAGGDRFAAPAIDTEGVLELRPDDGALSTRAATSQLGALAFGKRPGRKVVDKADGSVLDLDPGDRPRDRQVGAADWAREAPRSPPRRADEGDALVLEPARPAAAPRGHVAMATAPGRHVPARDAGGDVLTLHAADPGLTRQDRSVSFANAPNKPTLPKKQKRPRRQRPRPAAAMKRALDRVVERLGSVKFY